MRTCRPSRATAKARPSPPRLTPRRNQEIVTKPARETEGVTSTSHAPIRVVTIARVRLYREGLERAIGEAATLRLVGTAPDVGTALPGIRALAPNVIVLDIAAGTGAVGELRRAAPFAAVVALAIAEDEEDVIPFAEAGVAGYVSRDACVQDLIDVVVGVSRGETVCSPRVAGLLVRRVSALASVSMRGPDIEGRLTVRELEVARLLASGLSNKEIAHRLSIQVTTVKNHVHNILDKLGVAGRADAAALFRRTGRDPVPQPLRI